MFPPKRIGQKLRQLAPAALLVLGCTAGFLYLRKGTLDSGSGSVAYAESIHHAIAPTARGRIVDLKVEVGQQVKAGDVIAAFDGRALKASREGAVAELDRLRAALVAAGQDEDSKVTRSELWVLRARAAEHGDRATLTEVSKRMERLDGLLEKQLVPSSEAESARERLRGLSARVETYDQAAARGQAGLDKGPLARDGHARTVDVRVEPARIAVRVQEAEVKRLDLAIEELVLKAPIDGIVTTISHRPGEVVDAATEIVSIVTSRKGVVVAIVPERAANGVTIGGQAELHRMAPLSPGLVGDIIEVAPEVEEVPVRARAAVNVPAWGRRVIIRLRGESPVVPGEAFRVTLR